MSHPTVAGLALEDLPAAVELFGAEQLSRHAAEIAAAHSARAGRGPERLLDKLREDEEVIGAARALLADAAARGRRLTPAAEWLLDNFYLIEEQIALCRRHLPRGYSRELPRLKHGPRAGFPRVFDLAIELISHCDGRFDLDNLGRFISAYQGVSVLNLGELWAVPIMVRLALVDNLRRVAERLAWRRRDRDAAHAWAARFTEVVATDPKRLIVELAELVRADVPLSRPFIAELASQLQGQHPTLAMVVHWVEQELAERGQSLEHLLQVESQDIAADQASISNSITSLRDLSTSDWRDFVESHSVVEAWLRRDPAGVYTGMDFHTRDAYRHAVERLSRHGEMSEPHVAQEVVRLAREAFDRATEDVRPLHVGYYLQGEGLPSLERAAGYRRPWREAARRVCAGAGGGLYAGGLLAVTAALTGLVAYWAVIAGAGGWPLAVALPLAAVVASQAAIAIVNWLAMATVPPRPLPRMDFSRGIPVERRTVVAVPSILSSPTAVRDLLGHLEIHFLGNRDRNVSFALLTDFPDAPHETMPEDAPLLRAAAEGVAELNRKHGDGKPFLLLHRPRRWNQRERLWMGVERKRGKITDLVRFLVSEVAGAFSLVEGDPQRPRGARYVIVLDSDTQLPPEAAWKLTGTIAHPLNEPRVDPQSRCVYGGYGLLQPRLSVSLSGAQRSRYARLFSGEAGVDPYTRQVSDVYQDVFGQGSFIGKGILDVRVFDACLAGRFPENTILSHDLLEGCYTRCGFVSDVDLIEESPAHYVADLRRRHRWARGDWQIIGWLLPKAPLAEGRERNPLSLLSRWKIFDNLRRTLVPPATFAMLVLSWLAPPVPAAWVLFTGAMILLPVALRAVAAVASKPAEASLRNHLLREARRQATQLAHAALGVLFLPYEALVYLDAIAKVAWRKLVTRRRLLEWQTASDAERRARTDLPGVLRAMWLTPLAAATIGAAVALVRPAALTWALPFVACWLISPVLAWWMSRPLGLAPVRLDAGQRAFLGKVARRTWRFFELYANEKTHWLPADNFQETPVARLAERTSPTNIGFGGLANLAAWDFGYLTTGETIERAERLCDALGRMERFRGHFLNWYDTATLAPMPPRYVSTVDSGNLAMFLLTLAAGLCELRAAPILPPNWLRGLRDTAGVLIEEIERDADRSSEASRLATRLRELLADPETPPETLPACDALIKRLLGALGPLRERAAALPDEAAWWLDALVRRCTALEADLAHQVPWRALSEPDLNALGQVLVDTGLSGTEIGALQAQLRFVPRLDELAQFEDRFGEVLARARARAAGERISPALLAWLNDTDRHAAVVSLRARGRLETLASLEETCREFASMDFRFLFDPKRKLLSIGYYVDQHRLDPSYYDLLASESRLASFYAIARGQAPIEHWFLLGRNLTPVNGGSVLVSWSGSLFEYLMPLLIMPTFGGTLLDETCRAAVNAQIAYGKGRRVPWGISESGYNLVDAHLNYQYRAFGVPWLGLKRGLADDLVVAPYASVMALMVRPEASYQNLRRLADEAMLGGCGFYEAIDYTPRRVPKGQERAVVRSFMAHHSGMSLLSLAYVLLDRPMQRRFLSEAEMRAALLLLHERPPVAEPEISAAEYQARESRVPGDAGLPGFEGQATIRVFNSPETPAPAVGLLGNGRYHVALSQAGGGYSRWNDLSLLRWRADRTQDDWGLFCYLRDLDRGRVWSAAHQPIGERGELYEAIYSQGKVEFRRIDDQIETHTQVSVSPEDDVEVRRVRLTNLSRVRRRIELTTYGEVVLAPLSADLAHRAFSNLFVQTELDPAAGAILCTRRPRGADEKPPTVFHMLTAGGGGWGEPSFETDRARFLGRGRTPRRPAAMDRSGPLPNTAGAVLDPVIAIRRSVTLEPGQFADLHVITGAAATGAAAAGLVEKYRDHRLAERVFETAWTHAQVLLEQVGATAADAQLFNRLAAPLIYTDPLLRSPAAVIARNRRGQSGLWGQGFSGDLPIVLLTATEPAGLDLLIKAVQAHVWWRHKGLRSDLVILVDEGTGYRRNLAEQITGRLAATPEGAHLDKPGGVFVRNADHLSEDDRVLLHAVARITLSDRAGTLEDQAQRVPRTEVSVAELKPARAAAPEAPPIELGTPELILSNGLGGFTPDGREYIIRLEPGQTTPAPWANVIANAVLGTVVSESGSAYTWFENAHEFRLTTWHNDPVCDATGEAFYIRDEASGRFWSPSPLPRRGRGAYVCRHGQGYTVYEHVEEGVFSETTVYVATDAPVKFVTVKLRNLSGRPRRLSVTGYVEWVLGEAREKNVPHVVTRVDPRTGAVLATNAFNQEFAGRVAFAYCAPGERTFTGDRTEFIGRHGSLQSPAALRRQRLSNRTGAALDPCAALQGVVEVPEGQERQVTFLLGAGRSEHEAQELVLRFRGQEATRLALESVWEQWKRLLGAVYVETPDPVVNVLANEWALYQTIACRVWGRSGYYQSGGAFGFRDQLQDTMALLHAAPWLLREQLLLCASRQFREGDVQHWWHPPQGRGVRTHFSDDYLWLPYAACRYVLGTGDTGVLDEAVPFLEGRPVKADEEAYYDLPRVSDERAALYEHCVRAIRHGLRFGPHGLPLMGCGDWNDGMNKVGEHGLGESVWLAFFLYEILTQFPRLAEMKSDAAFAAECRKATETLRAAIEQHAWDGRWYRRAFFDDGTPMGSAQNEECQIDSIAQSWAVLSGAAPPERARQAMDAVEQRLVRDDLRLIQLFDPPFDKSPLNPGYIKGYVPGVRENGAQYTHAAVWSAMAFGTLRDSERAWRCFNYLNPVSHAATPEDAQTYKVEPYAVAADIYTNPQHAGRGGWTWYTGSAGWMYRLIVETLLGLRLEVDKLSFAPVLPPDWKEYRVHYRYRETLYHVTLTVSGPDSWRTRRVVLDGAEQSERWLRLVDDRREHDVAVELG